MSSRLVLLLVLCTVAVLGASGLFLNLHMERLVIASVDRTLHSKLQIFTGLLHEEHGNVEFELDESIAGEYVVPRSGHYYRVWMNGRPLAESPSMAGYDLELAQLDRIGDMGSVGEELFDSTGPAGEPVRVLRYRFSALERNFELILAESLEESRAVLSDFRWMLVATNLTVVVLLSLSVWLMSKYSLKPLQDFSASIEAISHKNLDERIDSKSTALELQRVAYSFNSMLDRLAMVIESQKRLVADASHELKTPLAVIKSECDVVLQRVRSSREYREALQNIEETTGEMARLVNDLLSLAILDAGIVFSDSYCPVVLAECIDHAVRLTEPIAAEREVKVTVEIDRQLQVNGAAGSLKEAFLNLVENGIKYNRVGGMVTIVAKVDKGYVAVRVTDTGVGIDPELHERVFERFYRADKQGGSGGTGLGLSIVKSIIEVHNGNISLTSTPGRGSCFTVLLPLAGRRGS